MTVLLPTSSRSRFYVKFVSALKEVLQTLGTGHRTWKPETEANAVPVALSLKTVSPPLLVPVEAV